MPKRAEGTGDLKKFPLSLRTTKDVRERLEREAAESGRSLAEEVERRVEESFRVEDEFGEVAKLIGMTVKAIRAHAGDGDVRVSVRAAVGHIVDVVLGPALDAKKLHEEIRQDLSEGNMLIGLKEPDIESAERKIALLEQNVLGFREAHATLSRVAEVRRARENAGQ